MEVPFFDLKAQYQSIKPEIDAAVESVFQSGQFIGGPVVTRFEEVFATLAGARHCVGVGNGTDAISIALKSLGVSPGDEIITPAFGWISSAETITPGRPVFADVLRESYNIDPNEVKKRITTRTKGVILVHLYGQAAEAHEVKKICDQHGLFLIEDCAQAHAATEHGRPVGTIGDAGAFSFYPTKNLGAYGDAGAIVTQDPDLEARARLYANHGGLQRHEMEGVNSRLDPIQAAVLTVKSHHLESWTRQRISHAKIYSDRLSNRKEIVLPVVRTNCRHTFHQFVIRAPRRSELQDHLASKGIQTAIHFPSSLPNLPAFRYLGHSKGDFPVATRCQEEVLSLPVYPELSDEQINYVCDAIHAFYKRDQ